MLNKNWIILFLLLIGSLTANSQTKLGFTYGLSQTMNSPGGEESEAIWATGVFIGYPFRASYLTSNTFTLSSICVTLSPYLERLSA